MTMIAASEFNDFISFGISTCKADSGHGGFCTAIYHTDFLNRGHDRGNFFAQWNSISISCSVAGTIFEGFYNSVFDLWIVVAKNRWAPSANEIDELITFDCIEIRSIAFGNNDRGSADRFKGVGG